MSDGTSNDIRAVGRFTPETGLGIVTQPTSSMPYRLQPADAIKIPKGADWTYYVTWYANEDTPQALASGYTATFTVRESPSGTAVVSLTEDAGITLTSGAGNIKLTRTAAQTDAYDFVRGWGQLSVVQTSGTVTTRLLEGFVDLVGAD